MQTIQTISAKAIPLKQKEKSPVTGRWTKEMEELDKAIAFDSFYKKSYLNGLRLFTNIEIKAQLANQPDLALKDLMLAILPNFNPELPPDLLLNMIHFIAEKWQTAKVGQPQLELADAL